MLCNKIIYILNKTIQTLIILAFLVAFNFNAKASHIVGGEINYTCTNNYTFKFTISLYMEPGGLNEFNSPVDDSVTVIIYNQQNENAFDTIFEVGRSSIDTLITLYSSPCSNESLADSVYKWNFEFEKTFQPNDSGYTLGYWRCCRPDNITNVEDNMGLSLTIDIPAEVLSDSTCNSSPKFDGFPPKFICATDNFSIYSTATDTDGDSLVYSLCAPQNGGSSIITNQTLDTDTPLYYPPFESIVYKEGFSYLNPFGDNNIEINSKTGVITGSSSNIGDYVVGICVTEYRDGKILTRSFRDIPIQIVECDGLLSSAFNHSDTNSIGYSCGLEIQFENLTAGSESFAWDFGFSDTNTDQSSSATPFVTFPDTGIYAVSLIAENIDFPGCFDTSVQWVKVGYGIELNFTSLQTCDSSLVLFNNLSRFDSMLGPIEWIWESNDTLVSDSARAQINFAQEGRYNLSLSATDQYGCYYDTSAPFIFVSRPSAQFNIAGDTIKSCQLEAEFINESVGSTNYQWIFGDGSDTSFVQNPSHNYAAAGNYSVILIVGDSNCTDSLERTVNVYQSTTASFSVHTNCDTGLVRFINTTQGALVDSVLWHYGSDHYSSSDTGAFVYKSGDAENVTLTIIDEFGCQSSASQQVNVNFVNADFNLLSPTGSYKSCDLSVPFSNLSVGSNSHNWTFYNGDESQENEPTYTYPVTGNYSVNLIAANNFCSDTISKWIQVVNGPHALPFIENFCDTVSFEDRSSQREPLAERRWSLGDGTNSTDDSFKYIYANNGTYAVRLYLEDTYGCSDDSIVNIDFYLPADTIFDLIATGDSLVSCGLQASFTNPSWQKSDSRISFKFEDGPAGLVYSNDSIVQYTYSSTGTYSVKYFVEYINGGQIGCTYAHSKAVSIVDPAKADFTFEPNCQLNLWMGQLEGDTSLFRQVNWFIDSTAIAQGNSFTYNRSQNIAGMHVVMLAQDENGCIIDSSKSVNYKPIPESGFEIYYDGDSAKAGKQIQFVTDLLFVDSIYWIIDGDSTIVSEGDAFYTFNRGGNYMIHQIVKNGTCDRLDSAAISVLHNFFIQAPEIFTPGLDDKNVAFTITAAGLESFSIAIYNRWGKLVYETSNSNKVEWDGNTNKDEELPTGTYLYQITATEVGGIEHTKKGEIYLLR